MVQALEQSLKKKGGRIVKLRLLDVLVDFGLIGSAFTSEIFFLILLLSSGPFRHLARIILVGRAIHLTAALLLVYLFNNPSAKFSWGSIQLPRTPLRQMCNTKNFTESIKLWGLVCVLGVADVTLFRYLPWLHSQFSVETKGFPSPFVFITCVSCKLLQTLMTISCQIVYLSATTSDLVFLAVNVAVTALTFLVNAVAALLWWGFLDDWQTADGSQSSPALSIARVSTNPLHHEDTIPSPVPPLPAPTRNSLYPDMNDGDERL